MITIRPLNSYAVLSTSIFIDWEGTRLLLDVGPGTVTKLVENRISTSNLNGVLISHSHIDHFWDLVPLLWLRYLRNQAGELKIICPSSDKPLIEWCIKVSQTESPIEVFSIDDEGPACLRQLVVRSFNADHETSKQPLGYVITEERHSGSRSKRRKIVYSGDSQSTSELKKNAEGADLLIIESTYPHKPVDHVLRKGHMTVDEALKVALKAEVKNVLLTHFSMRYSLKEFQRAAEAFQRSREAAPNIFFGEKSLII